MKAEAMTASAWHALAAAALVASALAAPAAAADRDPGRDPATGWVLHQAPHPTPSVAYHWLEVILEAASRSVDRFSPRPTILSREMAIAVTAMYDAWAAYDPVAVGTRPSATAAARHHPSPARRRADQETAIAYAVHRALRGLYPEDAAWLDAQLRAAGHDPANETTDPATAPGVGNAAAAAILADRLHDGANQLGDEPGADGTPYSDYTYYEARNPVDSIRDPDRWQPLPFTDGAGSVTHPGFLTAHWYRVRPFALERSDQFRPPPPPKVGSVELQREVDEVIAMNAGLTLEQRAIVEFMRDGPRSTGQSGHWLRFAQDVARRDRLDLDREVKLFFSVANVVFDAFIACWDAKRHYDSSRPWTLVRHFYGERSLVGWAGACRGVATIPASRWHPYSPPSFVTPPFPGYPSGHSTASGAAATILALFTGSDRLEVIATRQAGELTETECDVAMMLGREGRAAADAPATREIRLPLPTFSATAEMAGISRVLGGYHIQADNLVGLELGRTIARWSWPKYQAYFDGTAPVREERAP